MLECPKENGCSSFSSCRQQVLNKVDGEACRNEVKRQGGGQGNWGKAGEVPLDG